MKRTLALVIACGCVDQGAGPQGKKIDPAYITDNLLVAPPEIPEGFQVSLGGKVAYLGNTVDKRSVAPGGTLRMQHYWQVKLPPGPDWRVFAFVRGAPNTADFMNLPATDMEIGHGPATWRPGEVIRDIQDITLRPDWRSPNATLYIGLIQVGAHGIGDRMLAVGPHVFDRAIAARTFDVDLSRAPAPIGSVYIQRAAGPITIDGVANDPGWASVPSSPEFSPAEGGSSDIVGKATAKLTWDDDNLYAFVQITDNDIYSEYKKHDDPLWKQDCVEMFIDADNNKRGYVELQVNPNNATFDSWFAGGRAPKGDEAWDSGMITAVKVRGTPDVAGDTDQGWDVEIAIPWAAVKGRDDKMNVRLPPQVGDKWHLNIVRVDFRTGDKNVSASSWNRISNQDFHGLDRMLNAVFADKSGAIVATPEGASPPVPTVDAAAPQQGSGAPAIRTPPPGATSGSGTGAVPSNAGSAARATPEIGVNPFGHKPATAGSGAQPIPATAPRQGSGSGELPVNPFTQKKP